MIVGLDVGFGHVKWTTDGHTVHRMPAVAAPTWTEPDMVSGDHAWVVGEHAEREDATLAVALDSERLSRPEFQALLGYVFASLPDEPLRVVSGLPYSATAAEQVAYERQLRQVVGPYKWAVGSGRARLPPSRSFVRRRRRSSTRSLTSATDREASELLQEGASDRAHRRRLQDDGCGRGGALPGLPDCAGMSLSLDVGVHNVEAMLQRAYQRTYGAEMLDRERMRLALDGKRIYRFGQPMTLPVDEARRQVAERIRAGVVQHWGRRDDGGPRVFRWRRGGAA